MLLEIDVSGEATKAGMGFDEARRVLDRARDFPHLRIRGLMAIGPNTGEADDARRPGPYLGAERAVDHTRPFLNNLLTQEVESLAPGELRFGALLSPPGRLRCDLFLLGGADGVLRSCLFEGGAGSCAGPRLRPG